MREKMRATEALRTALAAIIEEEGLTWPGQNRYRAAARSQARGSFGERGHAFGQGSQGQSA